MPITRTVEKSVVYEGRCDGPCLCSYTSANLPVGWNYLKLTPVRQPKGQPLTYKVAALCPECSELAVRTLTNGSGFMLESVNEPKKENGDEKERDAASH